MELKRYLTPPLGTPPPILGSGSVLDTLLGSGSVLDTLFIGSLMKYDYRGFTKNLNLGKGYEKSINLFVSTAIEKRFFFSYRYFYVQFGFRFFFSGLFEG